MPDRDSTFVLSDPIAASGVAAASQAGADDAQPRYRSGAVARRVQMPVSTLRIWEQRYRVSAPATTATGQRLYSEADIRRLQLLRQLSETGHAIGTIAALDMTQLQRMAMDRADASVSVKINVGTDESLSSPSHHPARLRIAIVGDPLARRLEQTAALWGPRRPPRITGPFETLADVAPTRPGSRLQAVDVLLVRLPGLHDGLLPDLLAAAQAAGAARMAVLYGFTSTAARRQLAAAGVALLREPCPDAALVAWLQGLSDVPGLERQLVRRPGLAADAMEATHAMTRAREIGIDEWLRQAVVPPRRFDDASLAGIAGAAGNVACECPRHVAELLLLLANFEAYSAQCAQRSPADAQLHAYLHRVAGLSRALHEEALVRVADHEGIALPL